MVGTRHAHPIKSALNQENKAHTLGNIADVATSWDSVYGTMSAAELVPELREFCEREGMDDNAISHATVVYIGTRITLWAENSHISLGSAFAHPDVHGRQRYETFLTRQWYSYLV